MPLETINVNQSPYSQASGLQQALAYSGPWAFWQNQHSILSVNCLTGQYAWPTGMSKPPYPPHRPPLPGGITYVGDCWQSVTSIAASKDVPKWLTTNGSPTGCEPRKLTVFKWESGSWRLKGFIESYIDRLRPGYILGDFAYYAQPGTLNPLWRKLDLLNLIDTGEIFSAPAVGSPGPTRQQIMAALDPRDRAKQQAEDAAIPAVHGPGSYPPAPPPDNQTSIEGYTYNLSLVGGPQTLRATREGGGGSTMPTYCPNDYVTRKQMAVFLLKTKYGKDYVPPPATGTMFSDVPASDPFAAWIEQLAREEITAGKSPCER